MRTTTYTEEFIWEDRYAGFNDLAPLIAFVATSTKNARQRPSRTARLSSHADSFTGSLNHGPAQAHGTPKKRRVTQESSLPRLAQARPRCYMPR